MTNPMTTRERIEKELLIYGKYEHERGSLYALGANIKDGGPVFAVQKHLDALEKLLADEVEKAKVDSYIDGVKFGWRGCFNLITKILSEVNEGNGGIDKRIDDALSQQRSKIIK